MLAWQNNDDPSAGLCLPGLDVIPMSVDPGTARMDVSFNLQERFTPTGQPAGICGSVQFRTDVFDTASIEALIERLQRVVVAMTADPARGWPRSMCSTSRNTHYWMRWATVAR